MAVYRRPDRGNDFWVRLRLGPRRVRRRSPIQNQKGAEEFERQLYRELTEDLAVGRDPFAGPPPTLSEFLPRWLSEYAGERYRRSSLRAMQKALDCHLLPTIGSTRLDKISNVELDACTLKMKRLGLKPKTINNALSTLRSVLRMAKRWKVLARLPEFEWVSNPKLPRRRLTASEEQALVDACAPGFWQTFVVFLLHTGTRFSEAAAVEWNDLELEAPEPFAHIRRGGAEGRPGPTKTEAHRKVPVDDVVLRMLAELPQVSERIFPGTNGRFMNPSSKHKALSKFCRAAGIAPCGWHALRRTFASRCAERGVPPPVIQKLLGHTSLEMTMRYIEIDQNTALAARADIQRAMAAPSSGGHLMATKPLVHREKRLGRARTNASFSAQPNRKPTLVGRPSSWSG